MLRNLYAGQEVTVRTGRGTTDWFQIGKGVRQGYRLSPCLFNLYAEYIMRNAGLDPQGGLTQARRKAKRQGDLITILTPDVPLTPIPTGVAGPLSEDIVRFVLGRSLLSFKKKN